MISPYRVETLAQHHDRQEFDCEVEALNRYQREGVGQDVRQLISKCHVACPPDAGTVAGYYSLAAAEIPPSALPEDTARKLPRYSTIPVIRIGRLAIEIHHRSQGLGAALIANAAAQALRADIAPFALVINAKDDDAVAFYQRVGFIALGTDDRVLMLPLATVQKHKSGN